MLISSVGSPALAAPSSDDGEVQSAQSGGLYLAVAVLAGRARARGIGDRRLGFGAALAVRGAGAFGA